MRRPLPLGLTDQQRSQLESWSRGGSTPYRLVIRARIVLLASKGTSNHEIARLLRTNPITVARWRSRFALLGIDGIQREAPRSGSPPPVPDEVVQRIIDTTLYERPRGRMHWSTRSLARETGVSHSTVRRIWKAYGIRPDRSRVALLAHSPRPRPTQVDLVGVYVNPPQRAVALWFGNPPKPSRIAAGLGRADTSKSPLAPGNRWMADLVTTLNLLDRREPLRTSQRHRDQEFLSFLRSVQERRMGPQKIVMLGEASRPTLSPSLQQWLDRHPQVSAEVCTGTDRWKQKVVEPFRTVQEGRSAPPPPGGLLEFLEAVHRWDQEGDRRPRPFAWTEDKPFDSRSSSPVRSPRTGYS